VAEALRRLPPDVVVARNQRLKRAMDLSMKHEKLPSELRGKQTPFDHYLLVRGGDVRGGIGHDLVWGRA
jgi:ubiquinol-cytochrome c reductase subunit 7